MSNNTQHILNFQYHIETFYSLLRAGLVSRNDDVTYWTLYIYQNITQQLQPE